MYRLYALWEVQPRRLEEPGAEGEAAPEGKERDEPDAGRQADGNPALAAMRVFGVGLQPVEGKVDPSVKTLIWAVLGGSSSS